VDKLNEELAELLPLLTSEQRKELFAHIMEKNEDFYDEYVDLDEDERIEQYTETVLDSYEKWLGDLSERQEQAVVQAVPRLNGSAALRLQQRKLWQHGIQEILDSAEREHAKSKKLRIFFDSFNASVPPALAETMEANKQVLAQLTVEILRYLTPEQKEFFIFKTNDYIRIFNELAEYR
jgi:hypothetical protein